ncbi:hypothetical protein [Pseudodesulfovibrio methanolicus]|uniref:Uncharacterized protein n=1 Tax=Pseudodesulfovibrio methanolicus TaxID=3126690 RepID=A0ABZ2IZY1_9BACT
MEILLKLLDWPFLLFVGLVLFVQTFREEMRKVIARGGLTVTWGDATFSIDKLPEQLDENFAPLDDDIRTLEERVARLESGSGVPLVRAVRLAAPLRVAPMESPGGIMGGGSGAAGFMRAKADADGEVRFEGPHLAEAVPETPAVDDEAARQTMLAALGEGKYRWRSLDRLATVAGISTSRADSLLRAMPDEVVMGAGRQGRPLARLRSR